MAAEPTAASRPPSDSTNHGRRVVVAWLVLSVIATPLVAVFVGHLIPPGNGSVQATGQVRDNTVMLSILTPIICLLAVFFVYGLRSFHAAPGAVVDGPPIRNDSQIQILWIVARASSCSSLQASARSSCCRTAPAAARGRTRSQSPQARSSSGSGDRPAVAVHVPLPVARRHRVEPARAAGGHGHRAPRHLARCHPLLLGLRARRQGRRQPRRRQRRLRRRRRARRRSTSAVPSSAGSGTVTCSTTAASSTRAQFRSWSRSRRSSTPQSRRT